MKRRINRTREKMGKIPVTKFETIYRIPKPGQILQTIEEANAEVRKQFELNPATNKEKLALALSVFSNAENINELKRLRDLEANARKKGNYMRESYKMSAERKEENINRQIGEFEELIRKGMPSVAEPGYGKSLKEVKEKEVSILKVTGSDLSKTKKINELKKLKLSKPTLELLEQVVY